LFCTVIAGSTVAGCDRRPTAPAASTSVEEVIRQNIDTPIGQSISRVASSLAGHSVFVATDDVTSTRPSNVTLKRLRFKTAQDNQGRTWAYAYTSQAEFSRAFPKGSAYYELDFGDFFRIIDGNGEFAGIFLNSGSDTLSDPS
jgi:hypothetical protein